MIRSIQEFWERWVAEHASGIGLEEPPAWLFAALALTLGAAVLGFGAQPFPALVAVAIATVLTASSALKRDDAAVEPVAALLFGLGLWSFLQACPLPLSVLRAVSPKTAYIWSRAYALTGTDRTWASISLDPGASLIESLKWLTYGASAVTAGMVSRRVGLRLIAALACVLALAVAVLTLAHGLLHAHAVYGIYKPSFDPGPWGMGPLLNANNRAGYLNVGALAGLSLLLSRRRRSRWWPVALGAGILIAVSLLTRSRGGTVALAVGALTLVVWLVRKAMARRGSRRSFYLRRAIPILFAIAAGVALTAVGTGEGFWSRLRTEGLQKLHIVGWTRALFSDFALFGVGRGAFETVFPAYRESGTNQVYNHAENFVADWLSEWGLLVGISSILALGWLIRARRDEDLGKSVLRLALIVLLLQDLVDHALEMPGIALLATTLVAALASSNDGARLTGQPAKRLRPVMLTVIAGATAFAILWGRPSAKMDRDLLSAKEHGLRPGSDVDPGELLGEIKDAVRRHPADPFLPLLGCMAASHVPDSHPLRWLGWAIERDPRSGHGHLALAYFLRLAGSTNESLRELRTAAENDPSLRTKAADWAAAFAVTPADARLAVPEGKDASVMLLRLAKNPRFAPYRFELAEEASSRDSDLVSAHSDAALDYIQALESGDLTCVWDRQPQCIERARVHIRELARLQPDTALPVQLTARLLAAEGRVDVARGLLSAQCGTFPAPAPCWQLRITLGRWQADPALGDAIRSYYTAACANPDGCVAAGEWLGSTLEARGDFAGALEYFGRAARTESSASVWTDVARTARLAGQPRRATEALKRAQTAPGRTRDVLARLQEESSHATNPEP